MSVPLLVRRSLGVTVWRVLRSLLPAERCDVEVAPGAAHRFVSAVVKEICAEHLVAVAEKHVVAVPLIDTEFLVEETGVATITTLARRRSKGLPKSRHALKRI